MKLSKLCAAALIAVIGATAALPVAVSANQTSLDSTGTVTVGKGTIDPEDPNSIVDPEDPDGPGIDPETPGVKPNPDIDDKGIIAVSDLNFGNIAIGTTTANAASVALVDDAGVATGETRGNIVSFGDVTGTYTGYTIYGELTSQFTNGTTTLDASTITYTNPLLATSGTGTIAAAPEAVVVLSKDGGTKSFVKAANTEGSGLWTLEFGQSSTYTGSAATATDNKSVTLDIPTSVASAMTTGTYTATVTWTMGATA
ncbi:WxL domain-containing protein [Enterococcus sp. BWM-S5]|uniref:WxL domain-containing protein n=1 Tax=Enterococcus larvae TaxID=2794352 RepID=A0ABS4CK96_9ENTE|nr:WxL domain-containing protein [Enterococcus larvae]MBP1046986.1 WxL domain-containing protein [Enterococcus larvae]